MKKVLIFVPLAVLIPVGSFALFLLLKPPDPPTAEQILSTPTPSPKVTPEKDFERNAKLQADTDELLPLFDKMPPVPVYLRDEIINKKGTNTERGVAYTTCENRNLPVIFIKKLFYEKANRKQLVNILKHELTHAWQCRQGVTWGHDEAFRRKFAEVGGFGN